MSTAAAILTIAVGAILRYAVSDSIDAVNLETVGLILMLAGAAGLLIGVAIQLAGRRRYSERIVEQGGQPLRREQVDERY